MSLEREIELLLTRRQLFGRTAAGIGGAALTALLNPRAFATSQEPVGGGPGLPGLPHYQPTAKRVIYLFMSGGPSQLDLFDYKPGLADVHGTELPDSVRMGQRITGMTAKQKQFPVASSLFKFARHGKCGAWVSELLPNTATIVDDIAIIKTVNTEAINHDPAITYCFWLLTRMAWSARGTSFSQDLRDLGVRVRADSSALTVISEVADRIRNELAGYPSSGQFGEIAALAVRSALAETVGQQGPTLFGSSMDDVQQAFRAYSTRAQFGVLAHRFFADFTARCLRSFVDRELSNHVGPGHALSNVEQSGDFLKALDTHTRQAARIVEDFAGGWYSKHNWESKGEISRDETQRFVEYALRKLRSELKRGAGP
ncbi:MAG: DUF1501 domain-containing protein [Planctomycetes bacterium]|nr:DUF1501 domain-containing protein [Planctomycetota bacterium]